MLKSILICAPLLLALPASAQAPTLKAGDAAPAIQVKQWVKGEPVKGFAKDKIYVVEFWATWCPPCRESIPHLTEMQKKHADVTFVGVSVFERESDQSKVAPFVESMGDKMNYRVAMDDVPDGKKNSDGAMAKSWMIASGERGIPTAFIVDKTGHIVWIGRPMLMEETLEKVIAGKWSVDQYLKERAESDALDAAGNELGQKLNTVMRNNDTKAAVAAIDEAIAKTPKLEERFAVYKFQFMLASKDFDAGYAYGAKLVDGLYKDSGPQLNGIAWAIVDPENKELEKRDLKLALKAALRANEISKGKEPGVLDTLALVYFDSGDNAKAIEFQSKAVELVKGTPDEKDFQERLDRYKKGDKPGSN